MDKKPTTVIVERGNYFMGSKTTKNGEVVSEKPSNWAADPEGSCVVICRFDTEKNEPTEAADIFPIWDSHGIDKCIREKLALKRRNFPTPEEWHKWIKEWDERDIDICEICQGIFAGYDCSICPIEAIKGEHGGREDGEHEAD